MCVATLIATGCGAAPSSDGVLAARGDDQDAGSLSRPTGTDGAEASKAATPGSADAGAVTTSTDGGACSTPADGGSTFTPPPNPFTDPPRCTNRPVMIGGQIVTDDPRGNWCEYGACGQSGKATCRTLDTREVKRTVKSCSGENRCVSCTYRKVECGTTQGCITHDACYDERLQKNELDSQDLFWAFRAYCDSVVAVSYASEDWSEWMQGRPGPSGYTSWLPYSELVACTEGPGACE